MIVMLIFFSVFVVPSFVLYLELTKELHNVNIETLDKSLLDINTKTTQFLGFEMELHTKTTSLIEKSHLFLESLLYKIPEFIFHIFLIIFFYYYFSRDYTREKIYFKSIFKNNFTKAEFKFKQLIEGIIYGQILVRFIQALVGTIGFLLFGVSGAVFWGFMLFFVGFLPLVGTGLVWIPLALFYFLKESYFTAIAILVIGIIISTIDNFLLPYIVSGKTNMGPVIVLVSMIGGLTVFGVYGIILGPLFIGLMIMVAEELFSDIRKKNPDTRKIIWTEQERKKYKTLKNDDARQKYIEMINNKYKKIQAPTIA